MGSTAEAGFIHQFLRFIKWESKNLESQCLPADEEEQQKCYQQKFYLSSLIEELSRVCNPLIPTGVDHAVGSGVDHAVCQLPVSPPPEPGRYLCVSFGFTLFCIDLHNKNNIDDPMHLVQIPPIQLLQKSLPVSMGMFKLNSHTYMVGGNEFPGYNQPPNLWNFRLFRFLLRSFNGRQIFSRDTYHLSMSEDTLSPLLTPCEFIRPLNKSKVWPIIERIGDKIHIINSFPPACIETSSIMEPISDPPSHEVLDCQDIGRGWVEIPLVFPEDESFYDLDHNLSWMLKRICNHIVVGDRIYARSNNNYKSYMVFKSEWSKWFLCDYKSKHETMEAVAGCLEYRDLENNLSRINHVSQILQYNGHARCFATSMKYAETLYVLIALFANEDLKMIARAYLVTGRGQILCFQILPDIFEKFGRAFEGREATLINVDEHTMFAIVHGVTADFPFVENGCHQFLLISSFSVEEVGSGDDIDVESMSLNGDDLWKLPPTVEKVFVKVDVKDVYAYKKGILPKCYYDYNYTDYACVSACVL